jgi:hypothetical protein
MTFSPSPDLIRQWLQQWDLDPNAHCDSTLYIAAKASEWGIYEERKLWLKAINKRNAKMRSQSSIIKTAKKAHG